MMIPCTNDREPLALPWGQTPRLDSGVRGSLVLGFLSISLVTVSGQSGSLVGKGSARNCGFGRRLPFASLLRKCLISVRLETSGPQPAYLLGLVAAQMDLFTFIRYSDPTKVRIKERDLAKREVKLLKMTEGRTVSLDPPVTTALGDSDDSINKLFDEGDNAGQEHSVERDDDVLEETIAKDVSEVAVEKTKKSKQKRKTAGDASASTFPPKRLREDYHVATSITGRKSLATIRSLIPKGSCVSSRIAEPQDDRLTDSVSGLNLRTCPPSKRYVISLDDSHYSDSRSKVNFFARPAVVDTPVMTIAVTTTFVVDTSVVQVSKDKVRFGNLETFRDSASAGEANVNVASSSKLNEPVTSSNYFYASQDLDSKTLYNIYIPKWKVTNDSVLDDPTTNVSRSGKTEAAEAIHLRSQLSIVEAANAAKSTEVRDLKERNFALEGEKDALSENVATLESMTTSKETELASLTAQVAQLTSDLSGFQLSRDELSSKVVFLESERDRLVDQSSLLESAFELFKERMKAMQDEKAKVLGNRVAELDAQLLEMAAHLDEEFYPHFLTTISRRRWILTHGLKLDGLKAWVDDGKVGRDLSMIKAYNPFAEAKYIDVVNALSTVDFSLLSELKSKKDASMVDLMDSLHLEGPLAEIPRAKDLVRGEIKEKRLSLTDVMFPLAEPLSLKSLIGEDSKSATPVTTEPITTVSTTFTSFEVVHPLLISNDQALDTEPNDTDPPVVTFEKEELATSPE
ncbi:hypothetical protein Tco_1301941 [Tanacetum coccineum]